MGRGVSRIAWWLALAGLVLPAAVTHAQREAVSNGADAALTDGAVVATAESGSAIWYNPASLVSVDAGSFDLSGSVYSMRLARDDALLTSAMGETAKSGQFDFRVVPRALSFAIEIGDDLVFAAGVVHTVLGEVTLGAELETDSGANWAADHRREGSALHLVLCGLGWRFRDDLAFGWAVDGVYANAFSVDIVGGEAMPGVMGVPYSATDHTEWYAMGIQARFGLRWEPKPGYRIGWMLGSPSVSFFQGLRRLKTHAGPGDGTEVTGGPLGVTRENGAELDQLEPGRTRLGLARVWKRGWLALDTDVRFPMQSEARFNTGWGSTLRLGGLTRVRERLRVGAAVFAVAERDTQLEGFGAETVNFYGANVGVDVSNQQVPGIKKTRISLAIAVNYAYGLGTRTGLLVSGDPTVTAPQLRNYDIRVHDISFNLALRASR